MHHSLTPLRISRASFASSATTVRRAQRISEEVGVFMVRIVVPANENQ